MRTPLNLLVLAVALAACSSDPIPPSDAATPADQPTVDAAPDATAPDVTPADVALDSPAPDAPPADVPADTGPVDTPPSDTGCTRPDVEVLTRRIDCGRGGEMCPAGYECLGFSGIVLQQFCGRPCQSDCDCPTTERCGSYTDKAGTHPLCVAE